MDTTGRQTQYISASTVVTDYGPLPSTILILLLISSALSRSIRLSFSSNGTSIVFCTPPWPSTAGRLM